MTENTKLDVGFNKFVRRQTPDSKFSHWTFSDEEMLKRIHDAWVQRTPGYRPDVVLVPVDPTGFFTGVVVLNEGDNLRGSFMPRQKGEAPRKTFCLDTRDRDGKAGSPRHRKAPAVSVEIVLYSREALAEDGETAEFDWNIISVNANPVEGKMPIEPFTLMSNHFHDSGGTQTGMTNDEFVEALRDAYFFWKDKTFIG